MKRNGKTEWQVTVCDDPGNKYVQSGSFEWRLPNVRSLEDPALDANIKPKTKPKRKRTKKISSGKNKNDPIIKIKKTRDGSDQSSSDQDRKTENEVDPFEKDVGKKRGETNRGTNKNANQKIPSRPEDVVRMEDRAIVLPISSKPNGIFFSFFLIFPFKKKRKKKK